MIGSELFFGLRNVFKLFCWLRYAQPKYGYYVIHLLLLNVFQCTTAVMSPSGCFPQSDNRNISLFDLFDATVPKCTSITYAWRLERTPLSNKEVASLFFKSVNPATSQWQYMCGTRQTQKSSGFTNLLPHHDRQHPYKLAFARNRGACNQ